jgi:hypothetical protein
MPTLVKKRLFVFVFTHIEHAETRNFFCVVLTVSTVISFLKFRREAKAQRTQKHPFGLLYPKYTRTWQHAV